VPDNESERRTTPTLGGESETTHEVVFALMVFVLEPLLHPPSAAPRRRNPVATLRRMNRVHAFLLEIAAVNIAGARGQPF
jgi:hypothetical protein